MTFTALRQALPPTLSGRRAGSLALMVLTLLTSACAQLGPSSSQQASAAASAAQAAASSPTDMTAATSPAAAQASAAGTSAAARLRRDAESASDERSDLWQSVRAGFAMPDLDDPLVHKWEQWYASQPDYVQRMTERGGRYLFYVLNEVQRRQMPTELALLPFIESAFNPQAESSSRASGIWQFMPATGKDFELRQNLFRDDRRDVMASTRAALDYLQRLYGKFGDWQLALAAYNWGPGNLQRAIDRNRRAGLPVDFASLQRVPQETREYLPKLQAVKNIVLHPENFALTLPPLENHPYFLSVQIERDVDVALVVSLSGLSPEEFQQLNPQLNKPVILAAGTPQVLLPYDNANQFLHGLALHEGPLASWTAWVAPRTLKPSEAARLTGMGEAQLRELNRIPPRMLVKVGSTLLVPRAAQVSTDVSGAVADNANIVLAPEGRPLRRLSVKAGRGGESLASVARRYRVSAAEVALWNHVPTQARFKAGETIVLMVASAPARPAAQGHAQTLVQAQAQTASHRGTRRVASRKAKPEKSEKAVKSASAEPRTTAQADRLADARH